MAKNPASQKTEQRPSVKIEKMDEYVLNTYDSKIAYYWKASRSNKKNYKWYRSWTTILGALVTLIASLATADFITGIDWLGTTFIIATPLLAAALTIISGLSQNFQWGATWRDMVINAQRLEKERDRLLSTPEKNRDYQRELKILNEIILEETHAFFQRVLDSEVVPTATPNVKEDATPS